MHTAFLIIAVIAIGLEGLNLYLAFFGRGLRYNLKEPPRSPLNSPEFCALLAFLTEAKLLHGNRLEVLTDGPCFYESELAAIASARSSVNLEAYIFHKGEISKRYVEALAERARAGVQVRLTLDYIGSLSTSRRYFKELLDAGGQLRWYHPLRLQFIPQFNNRTHRELLIVDGSVAFLGGPGIADWWIKDGIKGKRWRDMMVRVEGPSAAALQAVFAQNWLRVSGEILTGEDYFANVEDGQGVPVLVVGSTPAAGATQARILFQLLITCARNRIYISSPYFLPSHSARHAIIEAAVERGVEVKILTPGDNNDQPLTRASSRNLYGALLKHGIKIYEYLPSMNHTKALMIDDLWAVAGSTNFDYRSFSINDEVNLAVMDPVVTRRIAEDFERDLSHSREVKYSEWQEKKRFRLADKLFSLLERQE
ncbi:MAG TPA: phospholipase D-like domain-containing protein [Bryobacteraceae bacterium]|jgi:cardiolipin synthase|nr:phospholipase D-like domain-containing protein [Bryobacteraceae bacterium]